MIFRISSGRQHNFFSYFPLRFSSRPCYSLPVLQRILFSPPPLPLPLPPAPAHSLTSSLTSVRSLSSHSSKRAYSTQPGNSSAFVEEEPLSEIPNPFKDEGPVNLEEIKKRVKSEAGGFISEDTLKKLDDLNDEEAEQRRAFKRVGGLLAGVKVAKFGGLRDMKLKRWYESATAKEVEEAGKWTVSLDDRLLVTRNEKPLFVPNKQTALALAAEWENIEGLIPLALLPLNSLAARAMDDMPRYRQYYHQEILDFLDGDHVCFRDENSPRDIVKEREIYDPIVNWFQNFYGLSLSLSYGCSVQSHPQKTIDTISLYLKQLDDYSFHLFHSVAHATKSAVTAFALWNNAITVDHAIAAVSLEEDLNVNSHGFVEGAHDLRKIQTTVDVYAATVLLQLAAVSPPNKDTFIQLGDATAILLQQKQEEADRARKQDVEMQMKFTEALKKEIATDPSQKQALQFFVDSFEQKMAQEQKEEAALQNNTNHLPNQQQQKDE